MWVLDPQPRLGALGAERDVRVDVPSGHQPKREFGGQELSGPFPIPRGRTAGF